MLCNGFQNFHNIFLQPGTVYMLSCLLIASGCPEENNTGRIGCQVIISMKMVFCLFFNFPEENLLGKISSKTFLSVNVTAVKPVLWLMLKLASGVNGMK